MKAMKLGWEPNEMEMSAVLGMDDTNRYAYFIRKTADQQEMWSLWRDGWVLAGDDSGRQLIPLWPHSKYAALCAREEWAEHTPKLIELDTWLVRWTPGVRRDGKLIAVFPTLSNRGVAVEVDRLAADLQQELTNYQ